MTVIDSLLYPELGSLAPEARREALARARRMPLDWIELAGIAAGVVAATWLTRYGVDHLGLFERLSAATANFVVAIPLLAIAAGPFAWLRTRRALRDELAGRPAATPAGIRRAP